MGDNISIVRLGYPLQMHPALNEFYQTISARSAFVKETKSPEAKIGNMVYLVMRTKNKMLSDSINKYL